MTKLTGFTDRDAESVSITLIKKKDGTWGGSASLSAKTDTVSVSFDPQFGVLRQAASALLKQLEYEWYKSVHPEDEQAETLAPSLEE